MRVILGIPPWTSLALRPALFLLPAAAALLMNSTPLLAQSQPVVPPSAETNPFTSTGDVAAGAAIFRQHCAGCHGAEGRGGGAPAINTGEFRHGETDLELYTIISQGIRGTGMPYSFFDDKQLWQVLGYVRSLAAGASRQQLAGDAASGKEIFHGKGNCIGCHLVGTEGGRLGPKLTGIGTVRTTEHLRTSLEDPNAAVPPAFYMVRGTNKDGKKISGRRMNESSFTVLFIDYQENLVSVKREDISGYEAVPESAMPSYKGTLSDAELDDVVAYLTTLKRER